MRKALVTNHTSSESVGKKKSKNRTPPEGRGRGKTEGLQISTILGRWFEKREESI